MRVLLISDGRPGHANLSEGIAAALARHHPVDITRLEIGRRRWPGPATAMLTRSGLSPGKILSTVYRLDAADLPSADVIVSAGAETLAANICAARLHEAANVFYGSLRQYRPRDFALVLTSYPRAATHGNVLQALKPSALDPDTLPKLSPIDTATPPRRLGLIVGGPTSGITYSDDDWHKLIALLEATGTAWQARWIVSNSRRTPAEASAHLRRLAAAPDGPIAEFIDVDAPGAASLTSLFAGVEAVVCTADSSSMISETVWARRPLLTVEPTKFGLTENESEYRAWLERNDWCRSARLADLDPAGLTVHLQSITPLQINPLDTLADVLVKHLPALADL